MASGARRSLHEEAEFATVTHQVQQRRLAKLVLEKQMARLGERLTQAERDEQKRTAGAGAYSTAKERKRRAEKASAKARRREQTRAARIGTGKKDEL